MYHMYCECSNKAEHAYSHMISISSDGQWRATEQDLPVQLHTTPNEFHAIDFAVNMDVDWQDEENHWDDEVPCAVVCAKPARRYQNSVRINPQSLDSWHLICILTGCPIERMGRIQWWGILL